MPFPRKLLLEGETVALDLRPHWWFFAGPLFSGIPVIALLVSWQTTHFVLTSDRLIFRSGILAKHSRDIPLEKVEYLDSRQSFFERLIGAGDLVIKSGDEQQQAFSNIPHPDAVQREINRQMESNQSRAFGGGPARHHPSVPEQIAALADLLDRGAISQAEFEVKKAQLLDRL
jgi:hypothetical protein